MWVTIGASGKSIRAVEGAGWRGESREREESESERDRGRGCFKCAAFNLPFVYLLRIFVQVLNCSRSSLTNYRNSQRRTFTLSTTGSTKSATRPRTMRSSTSPSSQRGTSARRSRTTGGEQNVKRDAEKRFGAQLCRTINQIIRSLFISAPFSAQTATCLSRPLPDASPPTNWRTSRWTSSRAKMVRSTLRASISARTGTSPCPSSSSSTTLTRPTTASQTKGACLRSIQTSLRRVTSMWLLCFLRRRRDHVVSTAAQSCGALQCGSLFDLLLRRQTPHWKLTFSPSPRGLISFYFRRIIRTDISKPSPPETWEAVIPEHPTDLLMWAAASKVRSFATIFVQHYFRLLRILLTPFPSRPFFSAGRLAGDLLPARRPKRAAAAKAQLWRAPARNQAPVQRARLGFVVQHQAQALRGLLQRHVVHRARRDVPVRRNSVFNACKSPCGAFPPPFFFLFRTSARVVGLQPRPFLAARGSPTLSSRPTDPSAHLVYTFQPLAGWIWTRRSPPLSSARPSSRATLTLRPNSRARKSLSPPRTERACPCLSSPLAELCSTVPTRRCSTATEVRERGFGREREKERERRFFFFLVALRLGAPAATRVALSSPKIRFPVLATLAPTPPSSSS